MFFFACCGTNAVKLAAFSRKFNVLRIYAGFFRTAVAYNLAAVFSAIRRTKTSSLLSTATAAPLNFQQFRFWLWQYFHTAQKFHMCFANVCYNGSVGACQFAQGAYLPQAAHAHFHNGNFRIVFNVQQCFRKPYFVIKIGFVLTTLYLQARQAAIKSLVDVLPLEPVTATTFKFFCLSRQALAIS